MSARIAAVVVVALLGTLVPCGCVPFSSHETARTLAPKQLALGAGVTAVTHYRGVASADAEPGFDGDALAVEALARVGVTPWLESGLKLSQAWGRDALNGELQAAQLGVKLALLPDELAALLHVGGTRMNGELRDAHVLPGVVWTTTLSRVLELDLAGRLLAIKAYEKAELGKLSAVVNAGVRLRSDAHRFELHPELSLLVDDLSNDQVGFGDSLALSLGLAVLFSP